jgi:SAM-dependent methyltransferase
VQNNHFGEGVAAGYDESSGAQFDPTVIARRVDVLADLAGDGTALEFAVGTGRVALPLAARGVTVVGIEFSTAMADRLRAKDSNNRVAVTIGDMATTRVEGSFRLVYLVFNTIGNLVTQDQQVACFANAAAHLEPSGQFLIEVGVPDLRRLPLATMLASSRMHPATWVMTSTPISSPSRPCRTTSSPVSRARASSRHLSGTCGPPNST